MELPSKGTADYSKWEATLHRLLVCQFPLIPTSQVKVITSSVLEDLLKDMNTYYKVVGDHHEQISPRRT